MLRDVLDKIWDLIGSVSEGFPSYFCYNHREFGKVYSTNEGVIAFSKKVHFFLRHPVDGWDCFERENSLL